MNAYEFLTLLELNTDANGLPREGDNSLMFFTNQAIAILGHSQDSQNIIFDSTTGRLPLLTTQQGIFDYSMPDNYWKINGVWIEYGTRGSLLASILPRSDYNSYTRTEDTKIVTEKLAGISYIVVPYVKTYDSGETTNARVLFTEDPGDTDDVYRIYALQQPNTLLSDSMPLPINPPYDIQFLFPATLELIRGSKNGKIAEAIAYISETLIPKYRRKLNEGEQGEDSSAVDRGF